MNNDSTHVATASTPPTIRRFLLPTVAVVIGMLLAGINNAPLFLQLFGLAAVLYGSATCIFALSTSLGSPWREILFLLGLPLYLCSVVCAFSASITLLVTAYSLYLEFTTADNDGLLRGVLACFPDCL